MYSRFVKVLKFFQLLSYIGVIVTGSIFATMMSPIIMSFIIMTPFGLGTPYRILFLVYLIFLCLVNYIGTQTIISVIDLLNRIEINTRNSRQN
jgi:uncharacterized membrane protein